MYNLRQLPKRSQYIISISVVIIVSFLCFVTANVIGYKVVALLLLMVVSLLAMFFDIIPVVMAALLSALVWNFFFIPPIFTFHINDTEDILMFLMYFVIAMVNAVLTFKIREQENHIRDKEDKEQAIKLYDTILNSLSHELRTPLSTIMAGVDALKSENDQLSENQKMIVLNELDTASLRLNRQVENLLNMNRLETGMLKLNLDWCDINEIIFSVIQKMEVKSHEIIFEGNDQLPLFKLDSGLIEQVIYNLIINSIQYTSANTKITIFSSLENENLIILLIDTGDGFPEQEIPMIFEKFHRLPNSKAGGTGLGLTIVKGYIEAHHGKIILENNIPHGARFTMIIPAEKSFINKLKNE